MAVSQNHKTKAVLFTSLGLILLAQSWWIVASDKWQLPMALWTYMVEPLANILLTIGLWLFGGLIRNLIVALVLNYVYEALRPINPLGIYASPFIISILLGTMIGRTIEGKLSKRDIEFILPTLLSLLFISYLGIFHPSVLPKLLPVAPISDEQLKITIILTIILIAVLSYIRKKT